MTSACLGGLWSSGCAARVPPAVGALKPGARAHLAGTAALSWGLSLLPTRMRRCERGGISIWLVYRKGDTEPGLQLQPALVLPRTDPVLLLPTGDWWDWRRGTGFKPAPQSPDSWVALSLSSPCWKPWAFGARCSRRQAGNHLSSCWCGTSRWWTAPPSGCVRTCSLHSHGAGGRKQR